MKRNKGFTLIECIAAFAIICLSIGTLYQVLSQSTFRANTSYMKAEAISIAQSLLVEQKTIFNTSRSIRSGEINSYLWTVDIKPYNSDKIDIMDKWNLSQVTVTVKHKRYANVNAVIQSIEWIHQK